MTKKILLIFLLSLLTNSAWHLKNRDSAHNDKGFYTEKKTCNTNLEKSNLSKNLELDILAIHFIDQNDSIRFSFNHPFNTTLQVHLGGGETIDSLKIQVIPAQSILKDQIQLKQQFINSLVIYDEGPRHYLKGWKQYESPLLNLKKSNDLFFNVIPLSNEEAQKFIPFQKTELYNAFLKSGGKRWANMLPLEYRPQSASKEPAYDGAFFSAPKITTILVKIIIYIYSHSNQKWETYLSINIENPEGHT